MSNDGRKVPEARAPGEWNELELAVRRMLGEYERWRGRAREAEARVEELETALEDVASGTLDPLALARRVEELTEENRALRARLERAGTSVGRILARLDFLEEER